MLLPPTEKDRVARLWALVDDGAGFDVVLDALISEGLRYLPGFVLVSAEEEETKVVIRGEARAWFTTGEETVEVSGSQATTWAERSVAGVDATRLVVGAPDEDGELPLLPIAQGLVRVSEVLAPAVAVVPEPARNPRPSRSPSRSPNRSRSRSPSPSRSPNLSQSTTTPPTPRPNRWSPTSRPRGPRTWRRWGRSDPSRTCRRSRRHRRSVSRPGRRPPYPACLPSSTTA